MFAGRCTSIRTFISVSDKKKKKYKANKKSDRTNNLEAHISLTVKVRHFMQM